jgi:hypothetical protein
MDSTPSTHLWISAFAGRLLQLQPGLSLASAINCAVENFHRRDEVQPVHPKKQEPQEPQEPHSARYRDIFGAAI